MNHLSLKFALPITRTAQTLTAALIFAALVSCGGGSSSSASDDPSDTTDTPAELEELQTGDTEDQLSDDGVLLPALFDTQTDLDLEYARDGMDLVTQLSRSLILPADIDVIFADCGTANAFYVPPGFSSATISQQEGLPQSAGGSVFMCHELTQLFSNFYSDKDQAVSASIFVLMHEIGHALVNQLELPVLGIEESLERQVCPLVQY